MTVGNHLSGGWLNGSPLEELPLGVTLGAVDPEQAGRGRGFPHSGECTHSTSKTLCKSNN